MKTPKEILKKHLGSDISFYTGCVHGSVKDVTDAMEEYAVQFKILNIDGVMPRYSNLIECLKDPAFVEQNKATISELKRLLL